MGDRGFMGLPKPSDGGGLSNELKNQLNRRLRLMEQTPEQRGAGASPSNRLSIPAASFGKTRTHQPDQLGGPARRSAQLMAPPRGSANIAASSVGGFTRKNEELTRKVERMKERLLRDDGAMPLDERNALLAETDALLEETDRAGEESRSFMNQSPEDRSDAVYAELREFKEECQAMSRERAELQEALGNKAAAAPAARPSVAPSARPSVAFALASADQDEKDEEHERIVRELREQNEALKGAAAESQQQAADVARLNAEKEKLQEELEEARRSAAAAAAGGGSSQPPAEAGSSGPESRLRAVLTSRTATILDMKSAVSGAEVLLDEVKRELARRVLNEKRAAMEALYEGIAKAEDALLSAAIERARIAEVAPEDIEKGEKKLEEVRSMTDEQREKKAAHELEVERKKRAFMLVKRDDATSLKEFIGTLEEDIRWQDWRDYAGRNLWKCSQELGANAVRQWLREELGLGVEQSKPRKGSIAQEKRYSMAHDQAKAILLARQLSIEAASVDICSASDVSDSVSEDEEASPEQPPEAPVQEAPEPAASDEESKKKPWQAVRNLMLPEKPEHVPIVRVASVVPAAVPVVSSGEPKSRPSVSKSTSGGFSEAEAKALQASAQGAVVRDDADALEAVLAKVEVDVWSNWKNKAGKDLLTLSQERGSPMAYSVLAKALGLLEEVKRDTFEERETVWVFFPGEVQPMRATVLEDTPEEAEEIHVELWETRRDDEGEPGSKMVERCLIRKMGS